METFRVLFKFFDVILYYQDNKYCEKKGDVSHITSNHEKNTCHGLMGKQYVKSKLSLSLIYRFSNILFIYIIRIWIYSL